MRVFSVNTLQKVSGGEFIGRYLFAIKNFLVSEVGLTVRGSGDGSGRYAWNGITAALDVAQQGAGGAFDCWRTGNSRTENNAAATAGDAGNFGAWIVLEDPSGRQFLIAGHSSSTNSASFSGHGRVIVARAGSGGFDATAASATTLPAAPATGAGNEQALIGSRASGAAWMLTNQTGYVHLWGDDSALVDLEAPGGERYVGETDGGLPWGIWPVTGVGVLGGAYLSVEPVAFGAEADDEDPCVYITAGSASWAGYAWDGVAAFRTLSSLAVNSFFPNVGAADPSGTRALAPVQGSTSTVELFKGTPHPTGLRMAAITDGWGNYGIDQFNEGWASTAAGGIMIPWPDAVTLPLP